MVATRSINPESISGRKDPAKNFTTTSLLFPPEGVLKVTKEYVIERLKKTGSGFNDSVLASLVIPNVLYAMEAPGALFFSSDQKINLSAIVGSIKTGTKIQRPVPDYGIAVLGTSSETKVIVVDMGRSFIIHEKVGSNYGDETWDRVPRTIEFALTVNKNGPVLIDNRVENLKI